MTNLNNIDFSKEDVCKYAAKPWALCYWGGRVPGERPRTKLAVVLETFKRRTDGPTHRMFTVVFCNDRGFYKRAKKVYAGEIAATFTHFPTRAEVKAARKSIPVTAQAGE